MFEGESHRDEAKASMVVEDREVIRRDAHQNACKTRDASINDVPSMHDFQDSGVLSASGTSSSAFARVTNV